MRAMAIIGLTLAAWTAAQAEPAADALAKVVAADGATYYFDPARITVVREGNYVARPTMRRAGQTPLRVVAKTYVDGVSALSLAVDEAPAALLARLKLADKFVAVTLASGGTYYIRANTITCLRTAFATEPNAKSVLCRGAAGIPLGDEIEALRARVEEAARKK